MHYVPLIIDLVALIIIIGFSLYCRARGFIKTLSGILAIALAFTTADFVADKTSPYISENYVSPYIASSIHTEPSAFDGESNIDTDSLGKSFTDFGIPKKIVEDSFDDLKTTLTQSITELLSSLTDSISYKITYSVVFLISFLLSLLIYTLLFNLLNLTAKLPVLNFVNKFLGLILGLIFGYLVVMILSFILLKFGIVLSDEIIEKTFIIKYIMNFSLISVIA